MKEKENISPPRLAEWLFEWYCNDQLKETIQGDLYEEFQMNVQEKGLFKARVSYWLNVIRFVNRHTLKRDTTPNYQSSTSFAMLQNYILVTLRSLKKNLVFSSINISGLAIGFASCIIIFFYVHKELNYDNFHSGKENIYRVTNTYDRPSGIIHWARTPPALVPSIRSSITGVEKASQLRHADDLTFTVDNQSFTQKDVFYADSLFLEIFDFKFLQGDRYTALDLPNTIVITEAMALKYFGNDDPMGKTILLGDDRSLQVTGVLENVPSDSHIKFDFLVSFSTYVVPEGYLADLSSWRWAGFWTFIELDPNVDPAIIRGQIRDLYDQDDRTTNRSITIELQKLTDVYLHSNKYSRVDASIRIGNITTIYTLMSIACLVLLLAGFNFMNLSTAISLNRGKEIGVRKVMGAVKSKVAGQFLTESTIIALISLSFSVFIVWVSEPYFTRILGIELPDQFSQYATFLPLFVALAIIFGLFAGSYPSLVLAKFNPIQALRGNLKTNPSGNWLTKSLMLIQFAVSIGLITISVIIVSQMNFIKNKSLGFDKENVLVARISRDIMRDKYDVIEQQFLQNPRVLNISQSSGALNRGGGSGGAYLVGDDPENIQQLSYYQTTYDFLEVTGIELLQGRFFSLDFPGDAESAVILNESAVAAMELENPVNSRIQFTNREMTVVGVVKDFNYASLHSPIAPMAILMPFAHQDQILLKISPGPIDGLVSSLRNKWVETVGSVPIEITFLDEGIQQMYEKEEKLSSLIYLFSSLTIILGCLGLYGLVAFTIHAKLKEVGVRKVLGASTRQIFYGLSRQFIILILLSNIISWPVTYYFADQWLQNFAYRIDMEWWMFALSGTVLLVIALVTISNQTIKAALMNPVKVLKAE